MEPTLSNQIKQNRISKYTKNHVFMNWKFKHNSYDKCRTCHNTNLALLYCIFIFIFFGGWGLNPKQLN